MLSHWRELMRGTEGKHQGSWWRSRQSPAQVLRMLFCKSPLRAARPWTSEICRPAVFFGEWGPDHQKQMVKSEANKLKEGNRARAGPGFRNSGMGCWALVLRLTVESVQSQVIPGPYGSKVSSNTGAFLRVLTPCPDTEETPHVRASGL